MYIKFVVINTRSNKNHRNIKQTILVTYIHTYMHAPVNNYVCILFITCGKL